MFLGVFLVPSPALGYEFGPTVRQTGPEETVFDWTTDRCEEWHIPDSPARAFRDASNQVQLTLSHNVNRRMIGPDLNSVAVDCTVTMSSHGNADPAAYDDQEWIHSLYTADGTKVVALIHEEYQGWSHPGMCESQGQSSRPKLTTTPPPPEIGYQLSCWYNSITLATSTDGGLSYVHTNPPTQLAASVPYQYVQYIYPYGLFSPSNIIRKSDNYFYSLFYAVGYGAQQTGICAVRTRNLANPTSWRAWDGTGFNVRFINPYLEPGPPEEHVCAPVSYNQIHVMHESLTNNSYFGKHLLVGEGGFGGEPVYGVYYSTSNNLVNWSQAKLLMKAELPYTYECGDENPLAYFALLNPGAASPTASRNFEITGKKTYLYFTRFNNDNCVLGPDRDLIRIPIEFIGTTPVEP